MEVKKWINWTLALAVLAMLLQIAGVVAPMWVWLKVDTFTAGVGLWFSTGCGIDGTCNTTAPSVSFGYGSDDTYAKSEFKAVQALQTLGLAGAVLLVLLLAVYRMGFDKWTHMGQLNLAAFFICLLAWLCVVAGLIVYCVAYWPVAGTSPLVSDLSFPWSLLLCLLAAVLLLVVSVLVRAKCRSSVYLKHAIPMSGDAKMDLHPVTKQGLLHRYFTPAYHESRRPDYALGFNDEGSVISGMNRRLIGSEEHHVAAIDNVALNGNTLENGVNYRYLPAAGDAVTRSEIEVRRSFLPTFLVTNHDHDHDHDHNDIGRSNASYVVNRTDTHMTEATPSQAASFHEGQNGGVKSYTNGGLTHYNDELKDAPRNLTRYDDSGAARTFTNGTSYVDGGEAMNVTRRDDVTNYRAGGVTTEVRRYVTSTHYDTGNLTRNVTRDDERVYNDGGAVMYQTTHVVREGERGPAVPETRPKLTGPIVTSGAYIAGVTDAARDLLMVDGTTDARFTHDGRMTADAPFLSPEDRRRDGAMSQTGSNHSSGTSALQFTTHLRPTSNQLATRSVLPLAASSSMYDPTYIYRPFTEQIY